MMKNEAKVLINRITTSVEEMLNTILQVILSHDLVRTIINKSCLNNPVILLSGQSTFLWKNFSLSFQIFLKI